MFWSQKFPAHKAPDSRLAKEKSEVDRIHNMTEEERAEYLRRNPKIVTNKVRHLLLLIWDPKAVYSRRRKANTNFFKSTSIVVLSSWTKKSKFLNVTSLSQQARSVGAVDQIKAKKVS